jgi:hypothetical protein
MFITDYIKVYENAMPDDLCAAILFSASIHSPDVVEQLEKPVDDDTLIVRKHLELDLTTLSDFGSSSNPCS